MNRIYLFTVAFFAALTVCGQNIAVVSPGNATTIYQTLDEAITGATSGSTIYLPGGGFQISNGTKIDKKLTIMGVSHRGDTDNADGASIISGNLNFIGGASGSAVMGVNVIGTIYVGTSEAAVNNFILRHCNISVIRVQNSRSTGMIVNQCYLRSGAHFGGCSVKITNCISNEIVNINAGTIDHNIFVSRSGPDGYYRYNLPSVYNSTITNNFFLNWGEGHENDGSCSIFNNCIGTGSWGNNPIILDKETPWNNVFYANKGVTITSDYRIKEKSEKFKGSDGTYIGIEGGSGFNPKSLAPIPRIVSKKVAEQADGTGKLKIEVTVKSN